MCHVLRSIIIDASLATVHCFNAYTGCSVRLFWCTASARLHNRKQIINGCEQAAWESLPLSTRHNQSFFSKDTSHVAICASALCLLCMLQDGLVSVPGRLFEGSLLLGGAAQAVLGSSALSQPNIMIHPTLIAGWCGLVTTALNCLPVGSLDGGRMTQVSRHHLHARARLHAPLPILPCGNAQFFWGASRDLPKYT